MSFLFQMADSFTEGWEICTEQEICRSDKHMREHLSEQQIDKMIKDSFPASDPPSTY